MASRMRRGDTIDEQWRLIAPLLPNQKRGGKWNDHRVTFDGILWVLRTGAPWRDLPERYGKWGSVFHRVNRPDLPGFEPGRKIRFIHRSLFVGFLRDAQRGGVRDKSSSQILSVVMVGVVGTCAGVHV